MANGQLAKIRNIRKKESAGDITETSQDPEEESLIFSKLESNKLIKKKVKTNAKFALSFGNEEEEAEAFKVTKSAASRKITQKKSKTIYLNHESIPQNLDQASISPSYTKEILSELRAGTPSAPPFDSQEPRASFTSVIPDVNAIHAAKKQREMLRQQGNARPEYISLSEETDVIPSSGKHIESRLVREEDEIGDADEELEQYLDERLALGKKARKEQQRVKKAGMKQMIVDADIQGSDDEELLQWEIEAIKKGANLSSIVSPKPPKKREALIPAAIPTNIPIPTLAEVESRLSDQLIDLQDVYKNHQSELLQIKKDKQNLETINARLEIDIQRTKNRYKYFQELKTFLENLVEFLDAKFPDLEKLEAEYLIILSNVTEKVIYRRFEDDSDDMALIFGTNVAGTENLLRKTRQQQREFRRTNRVKNLKREELLEEGLSTDDELEEADQIELSTKVEIIAQQYAKIFNDVDDEFRSISIVKSKFEAFKTEFREDYAQAYGSLSLPGVFEFYIRHQLLMWEPFKTNTQFSAMRWYDILSEYGVSNIHEIDYQDDDIRLLEKIVDKVILPKLTLMVNTFNPYSKTQNEATVELIDQVLRQLGNSSQKFKDLIWAFTNRLISIVSSIKYNKPTVEWPKFDESETLVMRARERYFWRNFTLLGNLLLWKSHVSPENLRPLIVDHLVDRCLLPVLYRGPSDTIKFRKILEIIPTDWLSPSLLERIARGAAGF
ncbi:hypothetical protein G9A89_018992 [Geosiphon pyriformis]|nr:hypothetical protein G9A89_018992 [Geosiphon pyriformis]